MESRRFRIPTALGRALGCTALWLATALTALLFSTAALAQDAEEPPLGWSDAGELTFVASSGNSESSTLGLRNTLEYRAEKSTFTLLAAAFRAESTTTSRIATGVAEDFVVTEDETTVKTAENYTARGRYDRQLSERAFWYAGAGWERNRFAGFDSRWQIGAGAGHTWHDDEAWTFKTFYGLAYTSQDDLVPRPGVDDSFVTAQLGYDYLRKLTSTTSFQSALKLDWNTSETDDWWTDWLNALSVSMTERLALKLSLQLLYDNLPSLLPVELVDAGGAPTGNLVLVEADELDTVVNVALVIAF